MASIWTILTKGYAEYETEKRLEPTKKSYVDFMLKMHKQNVLQDCEDWEVQQAYEYATDVSNYRAKEIFASELKARGL